MLVDIATGLIIGAVIVLFFRGIVAIGNAIKNRRITND